MITATLFILAAATGALARAEAGRRWNRPDGFPAGTAIVNVSGSFLLGLLSGAAGPVLTVLAVGSLGAYTTFSSFGRDAVALVATGKAHLAVIYVAASVLAGIGAAALGVVLGQAPT